jgi:DNA methylase
LPIAPECGSRPSLRPNDLSGKRNNWLKNLLSHCRDFAMGAQANSTIPELHYSPLLLHLPDDVQAALVAGARDREPARGLTHSLYKYPARFSPSFARSAIEIFTRPGDLVFDNHVGGGTTLVEALALGRDAIGIDISPLSEFVATVKTTIFDEPELERLSAWITRAGQAVHIHKRSPHFAGYGELGY